MAIQSHKLVNKAWGLLILLAIGTVVFVLANEQFNFMVRETFLAVLWPLGMSFITLVIATYILHTVVRLRHEQRVTATFTQVGINITEEDGRNRLLPWNELNKIAASIKPDSLFFAPQMWHFSTSKGIVDVPNDIENNHQQLDLLKVLENMKHVNWEEYQQFMQDSQKLFIMTDHTYDIWAQGRKSWAS